VARIYGDTDPAGRILTPAEITANFESIFGATAAATVADVVEVNGDSGFVIGTPVTLASGAEVTLQTDGTFDYDPNGAFDTIGLGLTASDSFTYKLDSNVNATSTVYVTIQGTFSQTVDTTVTLVGDVLTITDTKSGGNDNAYTLSVDGTDLVITEGNSGLIDDLTGIGGVTGDETNEVRVPLSGFNGINLVSAGGIDSVTIANSLDVGAGPLTINAETILVNGDITAGGAIALTGSVTPLSVFGSISATGGVTFSTTDALNVSGAITATGGGIDLTGTDIALGGSLVAGGAISLNGDIVLASGVSFDSSSANGAITFGGALEAGSTSEILVFNSGSGIVSFLGDVGTTATPFTGYTNQGSAVASFGAGTTIHTRNNLTTFTGPGDFLILGTIGETPANTGSSSALQANGATVTFGDAGNNATISIDDASGGAGTFDTRNGGSFELLYLSGPVVFRDAPDNAVAGDGSFVVGNGDNNPVIDFQGGNIEVALSSDGIGYFEFNSGIINLNNNNFITGQGVGSQAGTLADRVTIGGGSVEAWLNLNATVVGDWNTNSGAGFVEVLANGRVTANNLQLGSSTETAAGLDLLINGGIVELTGNLDYRTTSDDTNDKIRLEAGVLNGDADGTSEGSFLLRAANNASHVFEFVGGTLKGFSSFDSDLTQDGGTLQVGNDTSNGSSMTISGDYDLNAGTLDLTLGDVDALEGDLLAVTGNVDLTGTAALSLALGAGYNTTSTGEGNTLILLSYVGTLTGEFANYTDGQELVLNGNDVYSIDYGTGSNSAITLTFVRDNDTTAPVVSTFDPADGTTAVLSDSNLVLTFDDTVYAVDGGTIKLVKDTGGSTVVETWTFSGGAAAGITIVDNVVTINPTSDLDSLSDYHVEISGSANTLGDTQAAFENILTLAYVGTPDATSWNFQSVNSAAATVTIDQAGGQADPTSETTLNFTAVFSEEMTAGEFTGADIDFAGSTALGTLTAVVTTSDNITYNVAVSGMTGDGDVVVSVNPGAATDASTGLLASAPSSSTDDTVAYILNIAPTATNLDQTFVYSAHPATIALDDIVVTDANSVGTTVINTVEAEFINYPAGTGTGPTTPGDDTATTFTTSNPTLTNGFAMEISFTAEASDVATGGGAGSETRRVIFETGGSSNGSGIYLIDGIPYFIAKEAGTAGEVPSGLTDTDWAGNTISVPLTSAKLNAGEINSIVVIFNSTFLTYSVNGAPESTQVLLNKDSDSWSGNNTIGIGTPNGPGGLSNTAGSTWHDAQFVALDGTNPVASARMWNVSGGTLAIETVKKTDDITATLTVGNGAGNGTLSANQNTGSATISGDGTGTITISGTRTDVNLALSTVEFTTTASSATATISVSVDDGDEDVSGALVGTITIELNEAPTDISLSPNSIVENIDTSAAAVAVGTLSATDPENNANTFTLVTGAGDTDNGAFEIVGTELRIKQGETVDFESQSSYSIRVNVNDGLNDFVKVLTVSVTDANDAPVITSVDNFTVTENATAVGTVAATDEDVPAQTLTFSIAGGDDGGLFTIDGSSGALSFTNAPDFDSPGDLNTDNEYLVQVQVTDGTATTIQNVMVSVTDVEEAPVITVVGENIASRNLLETNAPNLRTGGALTVSDSDITDNVTASVEGVIIAAASTGTTAVSNTDLENMLSLSPVAVLDGSTGSAALTWTFDSGAAIFDELADGETLVLEYTIRATDDSGGTLFDEQVVTVTIIGTGDLEVTNTTQSKSYLQGATGVSLDDLVVSDSYAPLAGAYNTVPAPTFERTVSVAQQSSHPEGGAVDLNRGLTFEISITPTAADLVGSVHLIEIGGASNGTSLWLIDGIPTLLSKMAGNDQRVADLTAIRLADDGVTSLIHDNDFNATGTGTASVIALQHRGGAVAADVPLNLVAVFDPNTTATAQIGVNGVIDDYVLLNVGANNWVGDDSVSIVSTQTTGVGAVSSLATATAADIFDDNNVKRFVGDLVVGRYFNDTSGTINGPEAKISGGDQVTATLTLANASTGSLSAGSGNGETYDGGTGIWTITGTSTEVNAALAAVSFIPTVPNTTDTTISVSIIDDYAAAAFGATAQTGTITLNAVPVTISPASESEGGNLEFTVTLGEAAPLGGVTVTYSTADVTATAGDDYIAATAQTLFIAEGETSGTIVVSSLADNLAEGAESFSVTITGLSGFDGLDSTTLTISDTGTIIDTDTVYVDDDFSAGNIADADLGTTNAQPAILGVNAFTTISAALAAVEDGGTVIVNSGSYAETITLSDGKTIEITGPDVDGAVIIAALSSDVGTTVIIEGGSTLTIGDATNQTIAGTIEGSGNLVKTSTGALNLTGPNTYEGTTQVNTSGALIINGTHTDGDDYTVDAGAILGGSGTITLLDNTKSVTVSGTIATGGPDDTLDPTTEIGTLTVNNNVVLAGDMAFQINGDPSADLLEVMGTVALGGTLNIEEISAGAPTAGTVITLISNDGTDAVVSPFATLPEGATLTDNDGTTYIISYTGGTNNNDVVLFVGSPETNVDLDTGVLTITDINSDSTDNLEISFDGTHYVITDTTLLIGTTGFGPGEITRPDARTVRVDASLVTSIVVNTVNGADVSADAVTITSLPPAGPLGLTGAVTVTAEAITINDDIITTGDITLNGAVTLTEDVALDTSAADGAVRVNGTLNGAFDLTVNTGSGSADFSGAVGATISLDALIIDDAGTVTFADTVRATSYEQTDIASDVIFEAAVTVSTLFNLVAGDVTAENGFTADEVTVAVATVETTPNNNIGANTSTLTVSGGDVVIGDGDGRILLGQSSVAQKDVRGTVDFSAANSVTLQVAEIHTGFVSGGGGDNSNAAGDLILSTTGANDIEAGEIVLGRSTGAGNASAAFTSTIVFGENNAVATDLFVVGSFKSRAVVTIVDDGVLNLIKLDPSALVVGTNLTVGDNNTNTGVDTFGTLDLSNGVFNATLGAVVLAHHDFNSTSTGNATGLIVIGDGKVTMDTLALTLDPDGDPANSRGTFRQLGGTVTVANGVTDTAANSELDIVAGDFTVTGGGLSVDTLTVGEDSGNTANLTVSDGDVRVGTGTEDFIIGGYATAVPGNSVGTVDFTDAASVTIEVARVELGVARVSSGVSAAANSATGTLLLSEAGTNTVTASSIELSAAASGANQNRESSIILGGADNTINVDTITVGSDKGRGLLDIVTGGSVTFNGTAGAGSLANLLAGDNPVTTGVQSNGIIDLRGAADISGNFDEINLGIHGSSSGRGIGRFFFDTGTILANTVTLADPNGNGTSTTPANTIGEIGMEGGLFRIGTLQKGDTAGTAIFNWSGGTIRNLDGQDLINVDVDITLTGAGPHVVEIDDTRTGTFQSEASITGTGNLTKDGTGTLILASASTYNGETQIVRGTLALGVVDALPTGTLLVVDSSNAAETATFDLAGFDQEVGGISRDDAGTGGSVITNSAAGTNTLTIDATTASSYNGVIEDTVALTKTGTANLTLSGNNTYTGVTTVNAGQLTVGSNTALGGSGATSNTIVASDARVELVNGVIVAAESISIAGTGGDFNGALRTEENGIATWNGNVLLNGAARIGTENDATLIVGGVIQNGTGNALTINAGGDGSGTVVLSGVNTYSGATSVARGTLQLGADDTLPNGTSLTLDNSGASEDVTLDLNGFDQTIGALSRNDAGTGASTITNSDAGFNTLTVNQGSNTTYGGVIENTVNLVKDGVGVLTLSGLNTYTGTTSLDGGTITVTSTGQIGSVGTPSGEFKLGSNTTLNVGGDIFAPIDSTVVTSRIVVTEDVQLGDGTNAGFDFNGTFEIGEHTVTINDTNLASLGRRTILDNDGTLVATNGLNMGAGEVISGDGTVDVGTTASTDLNVFSGTISPGEGINEDSIVDGIIDATETLTIDGSLNFMTGTYTVDLDGVNDGDLIDVVGGGAVDLGTATLDINSAANLVSGSEIVIIANDGTDAVTSTFNNLPEGATVTAGGNDYVISYKGGDGNDVVLFVGAPETQVELTGTGELVITDIGTDSTDTLTVTYDATNNTYTISEADGDLVLSTLGLTSAQVTRTDAQTVVIDVGAITGGVTGLQVDTSGPTPGVETGDSVTFVNANNPLTLTGNVTVTADNINFDATADITSSAGNVTLTADSAVTMANGAFVESTAGTIDVIADGNVTVGGLKAGGLVTIATANGDIIDGGDLDTDIEAPAVILNAPNGTVGAGNALDTQVSNLEGTSSGNFEISNSGALDIGGAGVAGSGLDVGGDLNLTNDAAVTDTEAVVVAGIAGLTTTVDGADITLDLLEADGKVSVNTTGANSDVSITNNQEIDFATSSVGGNLTAVATDGDILVGAGVTVGSTGGDLKFNADDDFILNATGALSAPTGEVEIRVDQIGAVDAEGGVATIAGTITAGNGASLLGGGDADTFNVTPSTTTEISVDGNGQGAGEADTINIVGGDTTVFRPSTPAANDSGVYTFGGGQQEVNFEEVEVDNIAPDISVEAGNSDSAAAPLVESNIPLQVVGTLTVYDLGTVTASVNSVALMGPQSTLTNADFLAMLSLTSVNPVIDGGVTEGTINWRFDSGAQTFDFLALNEVLTLTFTVGANDPATGGDTQEVVITITGTNDLPVVAGDTGQVFENGVGGPSVSVGNALTNDSDLDESDVLSVTLISFDGAPFAGSTNGAGPVAPGGTKSVDGFYGTLEMKSDGTFIYTLDSNLPQVRSLVAGETRVDTFTYTVSDGKGGVLPEKIRVTINGADGASINGILISGGSSILEGFRFAEPGGFIFNREADGGRGGQQPLLTLIPTYSGSAPAGTIITIRILGPSGEFLPGGERVIVADGSGTWFATFDGLVLGDGNHYIQIESRSPAMPNGSSGSFRTFFSPGINGTSTEFQELTIESIFGRRLTSTALEEIIHENTHPIGSNEDWRAANGIQTRERTPGAGGASGDGYNRKSDLPESVEDLFLMAQEAGEQEDYSYAIFLLETALERQPDFEAASELLEELKEKEGQRTKLEE